MEHLFSQDGRPGFGKVLDRQPWVMTDQLQPFGFQQQPPHEVVSCGQQRVPVSGSPLAEETGMHVTVESLSGVYKNLARGIVALVFRCTPRTTSIHATDEAREVRWMTRDEIRQHMDPAFAIRALDAFEPGTQFRAHDGVHLVTS